MFNIVEEKEKERKSPVISVILFENNVEERNSRTSKSIADLHQPLFVVQNIKLYFM